jgi:hypothetical protein
MSRLRNDISNFNPDDSSPSEPSLDAPDKDIAADVNPNIEYEPK